MLKRFVSRMLCLTLLLLMLCGAASAGDYTDLFEKASLQIGLGSGVKGAVTVDVTGTADWLELFRALSGLDLQVRYIRSGTHAQTLLYLQDENEQQHALTQLDTQPDRFTLSSELLGSTVLSAKNTGNAFSQVFDREAGTNPVWYSLARNLLSKGKELNNTTWYDALEPVYNELDNWLNTFAAAPVVEKTAAGSTLLIRYEIPAESIKKEMAVVLRLALGNETLRDLLRREMTDQEAFTYFNPDLLYYYEPLIAALPLEGAARMERRLTTMGEELSAKIELPVCWQGFTSICLDRAGEDFTCTLNGSAMTVEYVGQKDGCILRVKTADAAKPALAAVIRWGKSFESYVEPGSTREHEITTWTLDISPETAGAFTPVSLGLTAHLHSKNANSSPTTALMDLTVKADAADLRIHLEAKTSNNWILRPIPEATAQADALAPDALTELLTTAETKLKEITAALKPAAEAPAETAEPAESAEPAEPTTPVELTAPETEAEAATATEM